MKGATRPWIPVSKLGAHGTERGKPLAPSASGGIRTSKSSTSLAFDSRLSKLKRASSEDTLTKPGLATASGPSRLKKTVTTGAISELSETRLRPTTGSIPSSKRTGIPAPRELPNSAAREKAPLRPRKAQASPTSSGTPTPTKHSRPALKPKNESDGADKALLESQVKELRAEAKTKDSEITKLRSELKRRQDNCDLASWSDRNSDPLPAEAEALIRALQEKNRHFQLELLSLGEENRRLKEKLNRLEHSPLSDTLSSSGGNGSLSTPTTYDPGFGIPAPHRSDGGPQCANGAPLRNSGSSSSDVTKASLSPDASDFEHIADVPSRPASADSHPAAQTSRGDSPDHASDLSVASLTERIQRMEENHHCTAEELQATLQELSDQQQMVQELTAENEKLAEEKAALESSFCKHRERAEKLSQEKMRLEALLEEQPENGESNAKKRAELEQRCTELQEKAQLEREKMFGVQQQLTSRLRSLEREHQGVQALAQSLREDNARLGSLLEAERQSAAALAKTLEDCKVSLEGLKIENGSLQSQLESERQKAAAMDPAGRPLSESGFQEMLVGAQAERDQLERACTELRQELLKAHSELKSLRRQLAKVEKEHGQLRETCDQQAEQLSRANLQLQEKTSENEREIKNLKDTIFELEDQVEQHRAVKLHHNQLLRDLEDNLMKAEGQKADLERQLKLLNRQIKEDAEEWRRFQADLQTAVVVANDIKCEAQQELHAVKRRLLEEEEKSARLQKDLEEARGGSSRWSSFPEWPAEAEPSRSPKPIQTTDL